MALHIVKLCVGVESVEDLAAWQKKRLKDQKARGLKPQLKHVTRNTPKRGDEIAGEGSLYWVIKGTIRCRQKILRFVSRKDRDGKPACEIHLDPKLVRTAPKPLRAFQGWRYFEASSAPADIDAKTAEAQAKLPAVMAEELRSLGLL
ncbi:MAG: DUF1489 domain-containing protein [Telmatospirillum sp.]|nr:DUF1489 domain-containing protein [Telmatospirillum sp.]